MAETTQSVGHPYPSRREDPYYDSLEQFFESVDAEHFANRDQWNISLLPTGYISVDGAGVVEWNDDIVIQHGSSGYRGVIPPNAGAGVSLDDGDIAWMDLIRAPQGEYEPEVTVSAGDVPNSDSAVAFMWRLGSLVWVRQVGVLSLGQSISGRSARPVAAGEMIRDARRVAGRQNIGEGLEVVGRFSFNADRYARDNANDFTVEVNAEAQVTDDGSVGEVVLWDASATSEIHTFTFDSDQPSRRSAVVSLIDPSDFRPYEVHAGMQTGESGLLELFDVGLEFRNHF